MEETPEEGGRTATPPVVLRTVGLTDPLRWLHLGWRDFLRAPAIGLFYGGCFMLMGWALLWVFESSPAYVLALSGGFLLMGPFLCLGMYRVSQRLENGQTPEFADSLFAWQARTGQLAIFAVVLLVLEMLWARATLVVFAISFDGMPDFKGSLLALVAGENLPFLVTWLALGAVFATLIYAVSVVSMTMILHRRTDAISAGLTSMRLVLSQTLVMMVWAFIISGLVVLAMLPWFAGLLVVGPVLGHASWHAYRATVAD
ncbi:conserved membrane hypothetical protein [Rubrivivax sp. A210]|uniref:DUF2189 domain-containing protein n=1 Tax=Rubrivivax sp. A210 TaxID=2772301 RepID=UPI00191B4C43|nr:DUF2189 domain-containing protein [Rubrivivax sp. A210]CAD5373965.1 conserved membrane hypothetical protein [Rubrivivax sp. A210]